MPLTQSMTALPSWDRLSRTSKSRPVGGQYGGVEWSMLGTFTVANGRITVSLRANGANGDIVADAVLLVPEHGHGHGRIATVASTPDDDPGVRRCRFRHGHTVMATLLDFAFDSGGLPAPVATAPSASRAGNLNRADSTRLISGTKRTGSSSTLVTGVNVLSSAVQAITVKYAPGFLGLQGLS